MVCLIVINIVITLWKKVEKLNENYYDTKLPVTY